MAVATTVKNSLSLATHRPLEGGNVLKVWNRTLVRSERQRRSAFCVRRFEPFGGGRFFFKKPRSGNPNVERRTFLLARQFVLPMFIFALWMQI
jgi:hypothetical protein